jgi:GGDEF domain-containing protein
VAERILSTVRSRPCSLPAHGSHGSRGSHSSEGSEGSTCQLTCSIGWSAFDWLPRPDGASPWEHALAAADEALYTAKRDGRDRGCSQPSGEASPLGIRLVAEPVEVHEGVAAPAVAA